MCHMHVESKVCVYVYVLACYVSDTCEIQRQLWELVLTFRTIEARYLLFLPVPHILGWKPLASSPVFAFQFITEYWDFR